MKWYTGSIDNFFDDPYKILEFSKKLDFKKDEKNEWPGTRTKTTYDINKDFFIWSTRKIIALLYPMNFSSLQWSATQYFQKIDGKIYKEKGWIHADTEAELTAILYLSKHKNCGTNIFSPKYFNCLPIHHSQMKKSYENTNVKSNKYLIENNERYEKTISFNSKFNRLIFFDGSQYHAAEKFNEENLNEERLTLITFFYNITGPNIKYPVPQMKRLI